MSRSAYFLGGAICGAVAGAIAGVLFAPSAGKDTRNKLSNNLQDRIQDLKDSGQQTLGNAKQKTETMIAKTLDAIDHGFEKLGKIVDERHIPVEPRNEARESRSKAAN